MENTGIDLNNSKVEGQFTPPNTITLSQYQTMTNREAQGIIFVQKNPFAFSGYQKDKQYYDQSMTINLI